MSPTIQYASFLIRLWREQDADQADGADAWKGEVEHVQTGKRWAFDTLEDLLGFLRMETQDEETSLFDLNG